MAHPVRSGIACASPNTRLKSSLTLNEDMLRSMWLSVERQCLVLRYDTHTPFSWVVHGVPTHHVPDKHPPEVHRFAGRCRWSVHLML